MSAAESIVCAVREDPLARAERFAARFRERGTAVPPSIRRAIRVLSPAPAAQRDRLSAALCELHRELETVLAPTWTGPFCPSYPAIRGRHAARLALGEKPTRVLAGLTAREAHQALVHEITDPVLWLTSSVDFDCQLGSVRDVPTARWLLACLRDPARRDALSQDRTVRGPHGEEIRGKLLDRIDEISRNDLPRGERTGVDAAFESAAKRAYERWTKEAEKQHEPLASPPGWWRPIRCARVLMSASELVAEGREMRHCVGTYARYVRDRRSVIVSICVRARGGVHRSTVELDRKSGAVRQHKATGNADPHPLCKAALSVCRKRWGFGG